MVSGHWQFVPQTVDPIVAVQRAAVRALCVVGSLLSFSLGSAQYRYSQLAEFGLDGTNPVGITVDAKGNVFGTCGQGGVHQQFGTVWEISAAGKYKTLYSFGASSSDGISPSGQIALDAKGDLFGTCSAGGASGAGTIWEVAANGKYKTIYSFGATGTDGQGPLGGVTLDSKGDLFGTCNVGGGTGAGTVWEVTASGVYKSLYSFGESSSDGASPRAGVTLDAEGDLFGTCNSGGAKGLGTVWEIEAGGKSVTLHSFGASSTDGTFPSAGVVLDSKGDLFGTCFSGGAKGMGTAWEIPAKEKYVVLHSFDATSTDGLNPGAVVLDAGGDLLGECQSGGTKALGTVWEITGTGAYKTLHSFGVTGTDGQSPVGLTVDAAGDLVGTAFTGGSNSGTAWKLSKSGAYGSLYVFGQSPDGSNPVGPLVLNAKGNLFGSCLNGGLGYGSLWEITSGDALLALHSFGSVSGDGQTPFVGPITDSSGDLIGTCQFGGAKAAGTLWKVTAGGSYTTTHTFGAVAKDGQVPSGIVLFGAKTIYGTCQFGGANAAGTVWEVSSSGVYKTIYSFGATNADGQVPMGLAVDAKGDLFGTCQHGGPNGLAPGAGTLWEITASGTYKTLHAFGATSSDGVFPLAGVTLDAKGDLFGTCSGGGPGGEFVGAGTVWELTAAGTYKTLHSFGATGTDGVAPAGGVLIDAKGDLFGSCSLGGAHGGQGGGDGTVWEITEAGEYQTIYSFGATAIDGTDPTGTLTMDAKGDLFGTCQFGGASGGGTVWELTPTG
jgi:uncharacterized repeat protein (TIGR03803 family)